VLGATDAIVIGQGAHGVISLPLEVEPLSGPFRENAQ
jgi:hypothetical protein